jgi:hypothetical protein
MTKENLFTGQATSPITHIDKVYSGSLWEPAHHQYYGDDPYARGGQVQNLSNFQMAQIPILSVLTCSTSSPQDSLKITRKIINHNPPVGQDKRDD